MEALLNRTTETGSRERIPETDSAPSPWGRSTSTGKGSTLPACLLSPVPDASQLAPFDSLSPNRQTCSPTPAAPQEHEALQMSPSTTGPPDDDDGGNILPPEKEANYEYHGPGSYLSICSKPGIEWVCRKTGSSAFVDIAAKLILDISSRLRLPPGISQKREREPEPEPAQAWQYVQTYFDEAPETVFGVVSRPSFEARLRAQFEKRSTTNSEESPSWYALRNAIYAIGCRAIECKESSAPFRVGRGHSWDFFHNSLSVQNDLLYVCSDLMGVQALTVMTFFVEGLGSPSLDQMLCSVALQLAKSKGLHRQPSRAWNLDESAIQSRSYIWWALYGYERLNAYRLGRPLSVDDNVITCIPPSKVVPGSMANLDVVRFSGRHARITGQIISRSLELRTNTLSLDEVLTATGELSALVDEWYEAVPPAFRQDYGNENIGSNRLFREHVNYVAYAYHGSRMAIHSILVHPWNTPRMTIEHNQQREHRNQVTKSREIISSAAREILQRVRDLEINAASPKWQVFHYPLTAFINLFINLLECPRSPSAKADLDLMYMAAGHFNFMEYASPDLSFSYIRDLSNLARITVSKAQAKNLRQYSHSLDQEIYAPINTAHFGETGFSLPSNGSDPMLAPILADDEWSTLLPWPSGPDLDRFANDFGDMSGLVFRSDL